MLPDPERICSEQRSAVLERGWLAEQAELLHLGQGVADTPSLGHLTVRDRRIPIVRTSILRPVGGRPIRSPSCVPVMRA